MRIGETRNKVIIVLRIYIIRKETPADYRAVEEMTKRAFWNVYVPGCDEHYLTHVMRDSADFVPELNLLLELDGKIIASVKYMKSRLKDEDGFFTCYYM